MVTEGDRLRRLQMREAWHQRRCMFLGTLQKCFDQLLQGNRRPLEFRLDPEAEIDGDLIIARARRMQPPRRCADQFSQSRLDIHVDVFELARKREFSRLYL